MNESIKRPSSAPPTSRAWLAYGYIPLPHGWIRLLRLEPHPDVQAPIQCQLIDHRLVGSGDGPHLYEALSYVWGSPENRRIIRVGEEHLRVTQNLFVALTRLRDRSLQRVLWVDAVCINQEDIPERGRQVQMMAEIYARASRVIVWLGKSANYVGIPRKRNGAELCLDGEQVVPEGELALEIIGSAARRDLFLHSYYDSDTILQVVASLLRRPWFRRIWVVQEIAAARAVVVMCDSLEIDGSAFCAGLQVLSPGSEAYAAEVFEHAGLDEEEADLEESSTVPDEEIYSGQHLDVQNIVRSVTFLMISAGLRSKQVKSRSDRFSLDICSIGELLDMYRDRDATDKRDKVFALLGMAKDLPIGIEPDYSLSLEDALLRLTTSIIGNQATVQTIRDKDTVIIKTDGRILGKITEVPGRLWHNTQTVKTVSTFEPSLWPGDSEWTVHTTAETILKGDLIFLPLGALTPTLIRVQQYHCVIVAITFCPTDMQGIAVDWATLVPPVTSSLRETLLVWDWQALERGQKDGANDGFPTSLLQLDAEPETGSEKDILRRAIWELNLGVLLNDAGEKELAKERLEPLRQSYQDLLERAHPWALRVMVALAEVYGGYEASNLRTAADILGRRGDYEEFTESGMIDVVKRYSPDVLYIFLNVFEGKVRVTDSILFQAIRYGWSPRKPDCNWDEQEGWERLDTRLDLLRALLHRGGNNVIVTKKVLKQVAKCDKALALFETLLESRGEEVIITEDVMKQVALYCSRETVELLLDTRGGQVGITEGVLEALCHGDDDRSSIMRLLLERRPDEVTDSISEEVLGAAAMSYGHNRTLKLLLDERGEQAVVTEYVLEQAGQCRLWKETYELLFQRRGDQVLAGITESLLKALANAPMFEGLPKIEMLLSWAGDRILIAERILITEQMLRAISEVHDWTWEQTLEIIRERTGGQILDVENAIEGLGKKERMEIAEAVLRGLYVRRDKIFKPQSRTGQPSPRVFLKKPIKENTQTSGRRGR